MSKSESPKGPEQLRKLFGGVRSLETTGASLRSHREQWGSAQAAAMRDANTRRSGGSGLVRRQGAAGGRGHECKAARGGRSCGPEGTSREDSQRPGAHSTVRKFLLVALKKTLKNIT